MNAATTTPRSPAVNGSLSGLINGIMHDAQRLLSQQMEMVKLELQQEMRQLAVNAAFLAAGALTLSIGLLLLCFMVVHLLAEAFPALGLGYSFLIVGGVLTLSGAALVVAALVRFSSFRAIPDQSLQGLKENLRWQTNLK
jgi:hypothetical protein